MLSEHSILEKAYAAFNARDIDAVLTMMHPEVDWPNGWEGGRVHGNDGVREYWTRQWSVIDPHVQIVRFLPDPSRRTIVDVQSVVRDQAGNVIANEIVRHAYLIENGLIRSMEIRKLH